MPKPQKVEAVRSLRERLEGSDAPLLTEFKGLKVGEMLQLRRSLAANGTQFGVVKNRRGRRCNRGRSGGLGDQAACRSAAGNQEVAKMAKVSADDLLEAIGEMTVL